MSETKVTRPKWQQIGQFFKVAIRDFTHSGTLLPSTAYAGRSIAKAVPQGSSCRVAEYGAGNGALTQALLKVLPADGRLVAIEVNSEFASDLGKIKDERLQIVEGDVLKVIEELAAKGQLFDAVFSGIPFSFLSSPVREAVVKSTARILKPQGKFIVYQNSPLMLAMLKKHFNSVQIRIEPRNIPPYFIMTAVKT